MTEQQNRIAKDFQEKLYINLYELFGLNYQTKMGEMRKVIIQWTSTNLTPIKRLTLRNTLTSFYKK